MNYPVDYEAYIEKMKDMDRHCRNYVRRADCRCEGHMREYMYELRRCGCERCYREYCYLEGRIDARECELMRNRQMTPGVYYGYNPGPTIELRPTKQLMSGDDMNLIDKVKNLKLSAADKLLRKHDVVDAEGDLTETGQELIWAKLLEAYKDDLVADLKAVEASEKAKK